MTWKLPTALGGWHPPSLAEGLLEEEVSPEPVAFPEENDERDVASLAHGKAWGKAVFSRYGAVTGGEAMQLELATDFGEGSFAWDHADPVDPVYAGLSVAGATVEEEFSDHQSKLEYSAGYTHSWSYVSDTVAKTFLWTLDVTGSISKSCWAWVDDSPPPGAHHYQKTDTTYHPVLTGGTWEWQDGHSPPGSTGEFSPESHTSATAGTHAGAVSGTMSFALSNEVNTAYLLTALGEWKANDDYFKWETRNGTAWTANVNAFRTESETGAGVASIGGGYIRIPLPEDLPAGLTPRVDAVERKMKPVNLWGSPYATGGTGSLVLTDQVTTAADVHGEWPLDGPPDDATTRAIPGTWVSASSHLPSGFAGSTATRGMSGAAWRLVSSNSSTRYRRTVRLNWTSQAFGGAVETGHADLLFDSDGLREGFRASDWQTSALVLAGNIENLLTVSFSAIEGQALQVKVGEMWKDVPLPIEGGAGVPVAFFESKVRQANRWGIPQWNWKALNTPDPQDPKGAVSYATLAVALNFVAAGSHDLSGAVEVTGGLTLDGAGNVTGDRLFTSGSLAGGSDGGLYEVDETQLDEDPFTADTPWLLGGEVNPLLGFLDWPWTPALFSGYKGTRALTVVLQSIPNTTSWLFDSATRDTVRLDEGSASPVWPDWGAPWIGGGVEVRRDVMQCRGFQVSRSTLDLALPEGGGVASVWAEVPEPGAGRCLTLENLRWVRA